MPTELSDKLHRLAALRQVSLSQLIEDLLDGKTDELTPDERWELRGRPKPTIAGIVSSDGQPPLDHEADWKPEPRSWR